MPKKTRQQKLHAKHKHTSFQKAHVLPIKTETAGENTVQKTHEFTFAKTAAIKPQAPVKTESAIRDTDVLKQDLMRTVVLGTLCLVAVILLKFILT